MDDGKQTMTAGGKLVDVSPIQPIERLRLYFADCPYSVVVAYLFGSYAREQVIPWSDIDIAILLDEEAREEGFRVYTALLADLMRFRGADRVVILLLNRARDNEIASVIRDGRLIYSADERARITFETTAISRLFDANDLHQIRYTYLRTRILTNTMGKGEIDMIDKQTVQEGAHPLVL